MMSERDLNSLVVEVEKLLTDIEPQLAGSAKPSPAIVDGKPIVVSMLPDGRPIFAAADLRGNPWKDGKGDYVVIDPQTGDARFKLPRRAEQSIPRMKDADQMVLAQNQLKQHPPGFLAFARAVRPVKKLAKTLQQRVWTFFAVLLGIAGWFDAQVRKAIVSVRKFAMRVADRIRPPPSSLNIRKLPDIERYLSNKAKLLLQNEIKTTLYQATNGAVAPCQYANMRVPLEPDGSVHDEYVRRWANFLNDMAARDIWKYGTLSQPSVLQLPIVGLRWESQLITFFFTDHKGTVEELNETVGFPVFGLEGSIDTSADWENFPW